LARPAHRPLRQGSIRPSRTTAAAGQASSNGRLVFTLHTRPQVSPPAPSAQPAISELIVENIQLWRAFQHQWRSNSQPLAIDRRCHASPRYSCSDLPSQSRGDPYDQRKRSNI
jgi:hypothetical protein